MNDQTNFNYITINSINKELNDKLVLQFQKSGEANKSAFLRKLIEDGITYNDYKLSLSQAKDLIQSLAKIEKKITSLEMNLLTALANWEIYKEVEKTNLWLLIHLCEELNLECEEPYQASYIALPKGLFDKETEILNQYVNTERFS